jgi:hypothetical protein
MPKHSGRIAAAVVLAALTAATAQAQAQDGGAVVVQRGTQSETVRFTTAGGVTVERGQPAAKAAVLLEAAGLPPISVVAAGDTLWIVDEDGSRLRACEVRATTQVGERTIRCTETALAIR